MEISCPLMWHESTRGGKSYCSWKGGLKRGAVTPLGKCIRDRRSSEYKAFWGGKHGFLREEKPLRGCRPSRARSQPKLKAGNEGLYHGKGNLLARAGGSYGGKGVRGITGRVRAVGFQ